MTATEDEEWVTISIPKRLAPTVYGLIAREMDVSAAPPQTPDDLDDWSEPEIRRAVAESSPAQKAVLALLAQNAGRWMLSSDLADGLREGPLRFGGRAKPDADWNTLAGTMGSLGRRVRSRYGKQRLFLDTRSDVDGRWMNRMSAPVASIVLDELERDS